MEAPQREAQKQNQYNSIVTVAQYYDNNTKRFLRFGKHKHTYNIHQALWVEGIHDQAEAVNHANSLVLREIAYLNSEKKAGIHVLDLGCGVGGSLTYLAQNCSVGNRYTGITISKVQAKLGQQFSENTGSGNTISILHGDYLELPRSLTTDLAYAIEAFVHAADAQRFFQSVAGCLEVGGRLILIDDFRTAQAPEGEKEKKLLHDFQQGWHASSLIPLESAKSFASQAHMQLIHQSNLTPYLDIGRPRDKAIGLMVRLFGKWMHKSTYFQSFTGGYAKQQCIRRGLVSYQMLVFEKTPS